MQSESVVDSTLEIIDIEYTTVGSWTWRAEVFGQVQKILVPL